MDEQYYDHFFQMEMNKENQFAEQKKYRAKLEELEDDKDAQEQQLEEANAEREAIERKLSKMEAKFKAMEKNKNEIIQVRKKASVRKNSNLPLPDLDWLPGV